MKKLYIILLLSVGLSANSFAQYEGLVEFTHSYFRSDPFLGQFSAFMQHLLKDEGITVKETKLRTDSSLFSFQGLYGQFNPFFFKPGKVQIMLKETPVQYIDSMPPGDTILVYQLTAFAEESEKGVKEVKAEFEKIYRKYRKRFFDTDFIEFKDESGKIVGAAYNYFVAMHGLAPLTVAWGTLDNTQRPVLNLTLRLKTNNNFASLPTPLYNP
ncbi:hypothetical protein LZZ85_25480 [Terrimonas sp. NA20]|uniref:Uncharacterized protein n=1 Tax=Terrimonas ginsenosidimutans TaxID=2908004 RepID=A0ABS9KZD6_9BACT|nr:hypothetical protein [Terrimonas ginsenosidimutans]MCG2617678.1 hypothetical protein [Terrimonas ginsenosidimutans]